MALTVYSHELLGDEYRVTMLDYLLPRRLHEPASYSPAQRKVLDRPSTMQDVAEFVAEYINSDVGIPIPDSAFAAEHLYLLDTWYHRYDMAHHRRSEHAGSLRPRLFQALGPAFRRRGLPQEWLSSTCPKYPQTENGSEAGLERTRDGQYW